MPVIRLPRFRLYKTELGWIGLDKMGCTHPTDPLERNFNYRFLEYCKNYHSYLNTEAVKTDKELTDFVYAEGDC